MSQASNFKRQTKPAADRTFLTWLPYAVALLTPALFIGALYATRTGAGFPLDDAWIHQTYARNLAELGEWSFVPGVPSAGSTAPLWTLLLAPGHLLHLGPFAWTWALGALVLVGAALAASALARALFPQQRSVPWLAALAVAGEWHLVWAATSGMETALFAAGVTALLALAVRWGRQSPPWRTTFLGGVGVGLLALVRPEGILLGGILGLALLLTGWGRWRALIGRLALLAVGAAALLVPYVLLNLHLSGTPFPNTFYAKQQEYAILYTAPLLERLLSVTLPLIAGPLVAVLPGLLGALPRPRREPYAWLPLCWVVGTWVLYAWRLPVTYQHGRYLIPLLPPLLVYGVGGLVTLWRKATAQAGWVLTRAWGAATVLLGIAFLGLGARSFVTDVTIINGEMVNVAHWVNEETPPDAVIAAHDIGALGYFARRPLLDLAGLISPEVIPFIRDEPRLLEWLEAHQAAYLVTFPSWYPGLVADPRLKLLYQTDTALTRQLGEDNMAVYQVQP